jgi:formylglycine-generating enzyme required for sulfatase activity
MVACSRAGKRLPKSDEWYTFAVGTPDDETKCNINTSTVAKTGSQKQCMAATGVFDAIGNAWEWTQDDVINGQYQGRTLPDAGYVTQVDAHGVATLTSVSPSELFYKDYFWSAKEGAFGILRGGFYGSKDDAGVYAVQAQTVPTLSGTAIGFRCVL